MGFKENSFLMGDSRSAVDNYLINSNAQNAMILGIQKSENAISEGHNRAIKLSNERAKVIDEARTNKQREMIRRGKLKLSDASVNTQRAIQKDTEFLNNQNLNLAFNTGDSSKLKGVTLQKYNDEMTRRKTEQANLDYKNRLQEANLDKMDRSESILDAVNKGMTSVEYENLTDSEKVLADQQLNVIKQNRIKKDTNLAITNNNTDHITDKIEKANAQAAIRRNDTKMVNAAITMNDSSSLTNDNQRALFESRKAKSNPKKTAKESKAFRSMAKPSAIKHAQKDLGEEGLKAISTFFDKDGITEAELADANDILANKGSEFTIVKAGNNKVRLIKGEDSYELNVGTMQVLAEKDAQSMYDKLYDVKVNKVKRNGDPVMTEKQKNAHFEELKHYGKLLGKEKEVDDAYKKSLIRKDVVKERKELNAKIANNEITYEEREVKLKRIIQKTLGSKPIPNTFEEVAKMQTDNKNLKADYAATLFMKKYESDLVNLPKEKKKKYIEILEKIESSLDGQKTPKSLKSALAKVRDASEMSDKVLYETSPNTAKLLPDVSGKTGVKDDFVTRDTFTNQVGKKIKEVLTREGKRVNSLLGKGKFLSTTVNKDWTKFTKTLADPEKFQPGDEIRYVKGYGFYTDRMVKNEKFSKIVIDNAAKSFIPGYSTIKNNLSNINKLYKGDYEELIPLKVRQTLFKQGLRIFDGKKINLNEIKKIQQYGL